MDGNKGHKPTKLFRCGKLSAPTAKVNGKRIGQALVLRVATYVRMISSKLRYLSYNPARERFDDHEQNSRGHRVSYVTRQIHDLGEGPTGSHAVRDANPGSNPDATGHLCYTHGLIYLCLLTPTKSYSC